MVVVSIPGNGVCNREIKIYLSISFSLRILVFFMRFSNLCFHFFEKKSITLNISRIILTILFTKLSGYKYNFFDSIIIHFLKFSRI